MARTKGTYSLPANIETNAAAPLDARERVESKADLTASGSFSYAYIGMQVYVVSEGKRYTLKGSDPTVLANWEDSSGAQQVQSDFAQNDDTKVDYIKNRPTLGTASALDVPDSGNAGNNEVVKGNDSRLSDSRPASDVQEWAKSQNKPSYQYSEIQNTPTLGTAAAKDYITSVIDGSNDLVTSDAVHDAIDSAISGMYIPSGSKRCEELLPALLVQENLGKGYNMSDAGTTTEYFIEGPDKPIKIGDNVAIVLDNNSYKFDLMSGFVDLSNYVQKSATPGLLKSDGSVDTNEYAQASQIPDVSGKADKPETFINGNLAKFDENGDFLDSGISTVDAAELLKEFYHFNRRTKLDITNNLSNLAAAAAEQNLGKYGYSIGDYFNGNSGNLYVIADLNTCKDTTSYSTYRVTTDHIGIMVINPSDTLYNDDAFSEEPIKNTGYSGSTIHNFLKTTVLNSVMSDFINFFGGNTGLEHLLSRKIYMMYSSSAGRIEDDQFIVALNSFQILGRSIPPIIVSSNHGCIFQEGGDNKQLELFKKYKATDTYTKIKNVWLRDISPSEPNIRAVKFDEGARLVHYGAASYMSRVAALILFH